MWRKHLTSLTFTVTYPVTRAVAVRVTTQTPQCNDATAAQQSLAALVTTWRTCSIQHHLAAAWYPPVCVYVVSHFNFAFFKKPSPFQTLTLCFFFLYFLFISLSSIFSLLWVLRINVQIKVLRRKGWVLYGAYPSAVQKTGRCPSCKSSCSRCLQDVRVALMTQPLRFFVNSRTLMRCTDPLRRGIDAQISVLSCR